MSSALRYAAPALAAALLFGASTPLAKLLVGEVTPWLLAGLLYLGSGLGLSLLLAAPSAGWRGRPWRSHAHPSRRLALAGGCGGVWGALGPVCLLLGLKQTGGAAAALLLNIEGVLTAAIAWGVFHENADRRIALGMVAIVLGGLLLSWAPGAGRFSVGALWIVAACLCWAIDNNLTRKVSTHDAMLVAALKGLIAGATNTAVAAAAGAAWPGAGTAAASLAVGFLGYGLSLMLFVVALRELGTARTGAYFSVAPLFGVILSFVLWPATPGPAFWLAAVLMAVGVSLHLREHHVHPHTHQTLQHTHRHRHDEHHQHEHDFPWDGTEPHSHPHRHAPLTHSHAHYPDIHHRHPHG